MAHMIDLTGEFPAIAYRGEEPWHGLGQRIEYDAPLEVWLEQAQLNWSAESSLVTYEYQQGDNVMQKRIPNMVALHRSDTGGFLGVVSENKYKPVQPKECLETLRELVELGGYQMEVVGALSEGKRIWGLARRKDIIANIGDDVILPYVLVATSYDKTLPTLMRSTSVRVVCNNTITAARSGDEKNEVRIRHSQTFNPEELKTSFENFDKQFGEFMAVCRVLASTKLTAKQGLEKYFTKVFSPESLKDSSLPFHAAEFINDDDISTQVKNRNYRLLQLFDMGPGANMPSARDTAFGALNAITHYIDHEASTRRNGRFEASQFGQGSNRKNEAMQILLDDLAIAA